MAGLLLAPLNPLPQGVRGCLPAAGACGDGRSVARRCCGSMCPSVSRCPGVVWLFRRAGRLLRPLSPNASSICWQGRRRPAQAATTASRRLARPLAHARPLAGARALFPLLLSSRLFLSFRRTK